MVATEWPGVHDVQVLTGRSRVSLDATAWCMRVSANIFWAGPLAYLAHLGARFVDLAPQLDVARALMANRRSLVVVEALGTVNLWDGLQRPDPFRDRARVLRYLGDGVVHGALTAWLRDSAGVGTTRAGRVADGLTAVIVGRQILNETRVINEGRNVVFESGKTLRGQAWTDFFASRERAQSDEGTSQALSKTVGTTMNFAQACFRIPFFRWVGSTNAQRQMHGRREADLVEWVALQQVQALQGQRRDDVRRFSFPPEVVAAQLREFALYARVVARLATTQDGRGIVPDGDGFSVVLQVCLRLFLPNRLSVSGWLLLFRVSPALSLSMTLSLSLSLLPSLPRPHRVFK